MGMEKGSQMSIAGTKTRWQRGVRRSLDGCANACNIRTCNIQQKMRSTSLRLLLCLAYSVTVTSATKLMSNHFYSCRNADVQAFPRLQQIAKALSAELRVSIMRDCPECDETSAA